MSASADRSVRAAHHGHVELVPLDYGGRRGSEAAAVDSGLPLLVAPDGVRSLRAVDAAVDIGRGERHCSGEAGEVLAVVAGTVEVRVTVRL